MPLPKIKAWRTEAMGIVSLVYTSSHGKARAVTVRAARDAGYQVRFPEVQVTRAPELDGPTPSYQQNMCLAWH